VVRLRSPLDNRTHHSRQLVNNEVFPPSLNVDLTHLFLDLKEGAKIVSLKPFVPETFKMNESNVSDYTWMESGPANSSATRLRRLSSSANTRTTEIGCRGRETRASFICKSSTVESACVSRRP
jgi:hypothetical protein